MTSIVQFLRERYDELEARVTEGAGSTTVSWSGWHDKDCDTGYPTYGDCTCRFVDFLLADLASKRAILELHEEWPVLLEGPPEFSNTRELSDPVHAMSMTIAVQVEWITRREYVARFGTTPPTDRLVRELAAPFADHPDFDPAWRR